VQKDTELADFVGSDPSSAADACSHDCPWRFGDTLTFIVTPKDVLGSGLRIRLRARSEISVGPLQFQRTNVVDIGESCVDLRRRALPGCVRNERGQFHGKADRWESPVLLIPLAHMRGGVLGENEELGQAVAHVALSFSTDIDPELILAEAGAETVQEGLATRADRVKGELADRADRVMRWLDQPVDVGLFSGGGYVPGSSSSLADPFFLDSPLPSSRNNLAESPPPTARTIYGESHLDSPDLSPAGWVSHEGPSGRVYWHHLALGPAPWESSGATPPHTSSPEVSFTDQAHATSPVAEAPSASAALGSACPNRRESFGPIVSPDLPQEGWTSFKRPDGRTFWHNTALGPPPWESLEFLPSCSRQAPGFTRAPRAGARDDWLAS
jgi:hypothetical protein